jgi:hypothetical protein
MKSIESDKGLMLETSRSNDETAREVEFRRWTPALAALAAATGAIAGPAWSQSYYDRSSVTDVASRAHPQYDAVGEHVGAFTVYPRASLTDIYDDNVYALPKKTGGDIVALTPSVDISSNWGRNSLGVRLQYERDQYLDQPGESSNEYSMTANAGVDVDSRSKLSFNLGAAQLTEPRTDQDSITGLLEPVRYDVINGGAAGYREFGRFRLDLSAAASYYSFYNVQLAPGVYNISGNDIFAAGKNLYYNEASRDEALTSETIRLSWAIDPDIAIFTQLQPNQSDFLHAPLASLGSYNSTGYQALAGLNGQLTHLIRYDVGIGYLDQHYSSGQIPDVTGIAYNVDATYNITQLITLKISGNHSVQAAGIPGSAASDVDSVSTRADYELLRNLIISPYLSYYHYIYPGTTRIDSRYAGGISATHLINSMLGLTASYSYLEQISNGTFGGYNFNDNRLSLALTVQR